MKAVSVTYGVRLSVCPVFLLTLIEGAVTHQGAARDAASQRTFPLQYYTMCLCLFDDVVSMYPRQSAKLFIARYGVK